MQETGQKGARENPWKSVKCQEKKGKCQWKNVKTRDFFFGKFGLTLNPELCMISAFSGLPLVSHNFPGSHHGGLRYRCPHGWTWPYASRSIWSGAAYEKLWGGTLGSIRFLKWGYPQITRRLITSYWRNWGTISRNHHDYEYFWNTYGVHKIYMFGIQGLLISKDETPPAKKSSSPKSTPGKAWVTNETFFNFFGG